MRLYFQIVLIMLMPILMVGQSRPAGGDYTLYEKEDVSKYRQQFDFELPAVTVTPQPVEVPPSQSLEKTYFLDGRKAHIEADQRLDAFIEAHKVIGKPKTMSGFRVQIFAGSRDGAQQAKGRFLGRFPGVASYLKHIAPTYRVRVGDYRTRSEAQSALNKFRAQFPRAWVVKDEIQAPTFNQN